MAIRIHRREFLVLLGSTATVWPLHARVQQPAMPVIGFLHSGSPEPMANRLSAFRKGLAKRAMSKVRTWRSNSAGRRGRMVGCQTWPPSVNPNSAFTDGADVIHGQVLGA